MSRALRTMDPVTQKAAIQRRLKEKKGGHGYFAAVDAQAHIDAAHKARKAAENAPQTPSDAGVAVTPDGNQGLTPGTALSERAPASEYIEALSKIQPDSPEAQAIDDHVVGGV